MKKQTFRANATGVVQALLVVFSTSQCGTPPRSFGGGSAGDSNGGAAGNTHSSAGAGPAAGGCDIKGNCPSNNGGKGGSRQGGAGDFEPSQSGAPGSGGAAAIDPCLGVTCNEPPNNDCQSATSFQSYDPTGTCADGECSYVRHQTACACQNHACTTDPCMGITCTSPPAAACTASNSLTTYAAAGKCNMGSCSYVATNTNCALGCANGACKLDPCAGMTCDTPPGAACKTKATATTYATTGTCANGTCNYVAADSPCGSNQTCAGAGVCSTCKTDSSCAASCTACSGATPKCKDLGATSQCVACLSNADCGGTSPVCNTSTNVCGPPLSCVGLAATCGPNGNGNCCASSSVTGVTSASFYRSYDGVTAGYTSQTSPAQVSDFRLDNYEITVGRFRKFVAAYAPNMIPAGAGNNPNNPSDTGWSTTWNASLDATQAALTSALKCNARQSWTDGVGSAEAESRPINCINWFEAQAFCIWDGGRLPTEAEWNYAAAGGTQQRVYPWGSATPNCNYANYAAQLNGVDYCVANFAVNRVGSESPTGDGLYGQSDLAGNVWEWELDWYAQPYVIPCINCSNTIPASLRVIRGGGADSGLDPLHGSFRNGDTPLTHSFGYGARCARNR